MNDLNLIMCMQHVSKVVGRIETFVDDECATDKNSITIEDLEGLNEGYTQLIYIENQYKNIISKIQKIKCKYDRIVDPIMNDLSYAVVDHGKEGHNKEGRGKEGHNKERHNKERHSKEEIDFPALDIYYKLCNSRKWGDEEDYISAVSKLVALKDPFGKRVPKKEDKDPFRKRVPKKEEAQWKKIIQTVQDEAQTRFDESLKKSEKDPPSEKKSIEKILFNSYRFGVGTIDFKDIRDEKDDDKKPKQVNVDNILGEYNYQCGNADIKLPVINSLQNIPQCMYYYYGDGDENSRGIYFKIATDIVVRVPMVNVIPEGLEHSRRQTLKCRNAKDCNYWPCIYNHIDVPYNKVGYKNRCPGNPGFSNEETLGSDIRYTTYDDIRMCLLYSMSDVFSIMAWCQSQKRNANRKIVISDLEICGEYDNPFVEE